MWQVLEMFPACVILVFFTQSDTPTEALTAQQGINPCLSYEKRR